MFSFKIAVLGSMKSGKSTFINSMIGFDLLPFKTEACTTKIISVEDNDRFKKFRVGYSDNHGKIYNPEITERENIFDKIKHLNINPEVFSINITGNVSGLVNYNNKGVVLLDTPGPDNYNDKTHEQIFNDFIIGRKYDYICFILNSEQLFTDSEVQILNKVVDTIRKKSLNDKLIFILNRIDKIDYDSSLNDLLISCKGYLKKTLKIERPIVLPISAYAAKIFKKALGSYKLDLNEEFELTKFIKFFSSNSYNIPLEFNYLGETISVKDKELKIKRKGRSFCISKPLSWKYYRSNDFEIEINNNKFNSLDLFSGLRNSGIMLIEELFNFKLMNYENTFSKKRNKY